MPRPGYHTIRLTDENEAHIRAICVRLGLDPDARGAKTKAINFALQIAALGLVKGRWLVYETGWAGAG